MTWTLHYADGSAVDGDWAAAPPRDVLAVVVPHDYVGREILCGEFYVWLDGNRLPQATDMWGVLDHLTRRGVVGDDVRMCDVPLSMLFEHGVKLGRNLDSDAWREAHERIVAVADAKYATTTRERRP